MDKGENGEVRYELIKGHGELFKVCRRTGEITLKQNLEGHNREYELVIGAYDGGKKILFLITNSFFNILL
jgi:protocadherin Fat 1/2/3